MRRALLFMLTPFLTACYTYAPIETATVRPGMSVRARITAATAEQLEPLLGTSDARLLNGVVIQNGGDTLVVEVPSVLRAEVGSSLQTLHQRVAVPRSSVLEIESRTLDRFRTTVVAGASAVVVGAVVVKFFVIDPGKEAPPGGGVPPELRIPIFRF